ncbi:unnamed protein product [Coffea canephora]|uniref:GDSL esterase/lipase n=1 Tax=Coffea canephora TaxID=49390 RepID=A0A068UV21_COFCA|nr:unnamed protein product [Coffea canephora]
MEIPAFCAILVVIQLHVFPCVSFSSFVFGDSLVDAGNNDYLFTLSKADSPPYGIDFLPSGGRPTGRFTNGRTIPDIIGSNLGATSFPPPCLAPNTTSNAIHEGINYASGASGILDQTGTFFIGRLTLKEQIGYFEKSRSYMVNLMGEEKTNEFLSKAIFSITIGSNDILSYFRPSSPFSGDKIVPEVLQDHMVSNLTTQLKRLRGLCARKFVVVGVGPLGCIPYVRATRLIPEGECSIEVNSVVRGYNSKLKEGLNRLNREVGFGAVFVYANSYDVFRRMIQNYHQYGFENGDGPCCGGYFPPFVCFEGKGKTANASSSFLCSDRAKYVFWDAFHPTEAANLIVAEKLLDGDPSVCSPMNIRQLHHTPHHSHSPTELS